MSIITVKLFVGINTRERRNVHPVGTAQRLFCRAHWGLTHGGPQTRRLHNLIRQTIGWKNPPLLKCVKQRGKRMICIAFNPTATLLSQHGARLFTQRKKLKRQRFTEFLKFLFTKQLSKVPNIKESGDTVEHKHLLLKQDHKRIICIIEKQMGIRHLVKLPNRYCQRETQQQSKKRSNDRLL